MTRLEIKCFEELDMCENHTRNPIEWIKRSKPYGALMIILFVRGFILWILARILMAIFYMPHEIYERLEDWV